MNIKNIGQILKVNDPIKPRLSEGNIINGKILSNENGKGAIKLYDGTIIPAIFISDNTPDPDKNIRFIIQSFDGENYVLKIIGENEEAQNEKSLNSILRDLNIPFKDGKDIIMSLIKYNLPATNENMNSIYKNMSFLDNLKNMNASEILLFLKEHVNDTITQSSQEFVITKNILSDLKNINIDFLSFMLENDIPHNLENVFKTQDFMNNKFFLNSFIDNIKTSVTNFDLSTNNTLTNIDKSNLDAILQISKKIEILLSNSDIDGSKLLSSINENDSEALLQLSKKLETFLSNADKKVNSQLVPLSNNAIELLSNINQNIKTLLKAMDNSITNSENEKLNSISTNSFDTTTDNILSQIDKNIKTLLFDASNNSKNVINTKVPQTELFSQIEKDITTLLTSKLNSESSTIIMTEKERSSLTEIAKNIQTMLSNNDENGTPSFLAFNENDKAILSKTYKNIEALLSNIDNKTLSNINEDLNKILYNVDKSGDTLLSKFIKLAGTKPVNSEKLIIESVIQLLNSKAGTDKNNMVVATLEDTINIFKENKDMFSFISGEAYKKLLDNLDIFKQMNNNYNLYFFNLYDGNNIFKNNIIIKNKFKGSKFVDINDVKAFITVDTKDIGLVEGNLYKKDNDISISFSVNEKFVTHFKNNLQLLKEELKKNGYDIINITVVKSNYEKNILPFSDFFNDSILKELDVKV